MTVDILFTTAIGYLVPLSLLMFIRRSRDPFQYLVLAAFAIFMGTAGMGKLLPFFGHSIVGGSLYFPTALLAMSMAGYYLNEEVTLRRMAFAILLGCVFVLIGAGRWLTFAVFGGEVTTHDYTANYQLTFAASVMIFKVYLATMIGVFFSKWRPNCEAFIVIPTIIEVVVTTPLAVYAAWRLNPNLDVDWTHVAIWTLLVRISLPVLVGLAIWAISVMESTNGSRVNSGNLSGDGREHKRDGS